MTNDEVLALAITIADSTGYHQSKRSCCPFPALPSRQIAFLPSAPLPSLHQFRQRYLRTGQGAPNTTAEWTSPARVMIHMPPDAPAAPLVVLAAAAVRAARAAALVAPALFVPPKQVLAQAPARAGVAFKRCSTMHLITRTVWCLANVEGC